jgi:hypothetical protein
MTHVPSGYAVIINNSIFEESSKLEPREGSEKDVERMEELFDWLQFKVNIYENKKAAEIKSIFRKYRVDIEHTKFDCFVLFLMSHGFPQGIFGTDRKPVYFQDIREYFTAKNCPSLANKPKLIFVQACRGGKPDTGFVVTDSPDFQAGTTPAREVGSYPPYRPTSLDQAQDYTSPDFEYVVPHDSDFMIAYASSANHAALRNTRTGGWFVTQLYDVMRRYANREDLQSMITRVTGIVSSKQSAKNYMQCPEQIGNLRKKLFFKPKGP